METTSTSNVDQKTILLVDDDQLVIDVIGKILSDGHYNVVTAMSGAEGLQKSRVFEHEIHLLLADFDMRGMTGSELATAINIDRPEIKVLLMSGFEGGTLILNEGWHFLPKPFVPTQLRALITTLVFPDKKSRF